jgi:ankyrin repeat protein
MNNITNNTNTLTTIPNNEYNITALNTYYNSGNNYEYNIFFNTVNDYQSPSILDNSIINIDAKYLTSIEDFMKLVETEQFTTILLELNNNITKFTQLANLYIEDETTKKIFNDSIKKLIDKTNDTSNYIAFGQSIINLFTTTRANLAKIVPIIQQLSQYHHNSELATQEAKDFYAKCNISYDILKNLIYDSITDIDSCLNGVNNRFITLYNTLEAYFFGNLGLLTNKKNELVAILIQKIEIDMLNHGIKKYNSMISIHFHSTVKDILAKKFNLQYTQDDYTKYICIDNSLKNKIINISELELLPVNITKSLANDLMEKFKSLLIAHNCLQWLNTSLPAEYFIDNNIFVEVDESFLKICNALYNITQNDNCLELEYQRENLGFYDIIETEYKNNKDFYSIKNIDSKLHAWITSSYLPLTTHRIITDISNQELIIDNNSLAIAAMGNCYFWVVDKSLITNNKLFDLNNYISLDLSHIPVNICNKISEDSYIPLIIQALQQTNNAKKIVAFFNRKDIHEAIQDNLVFIEHINNILSIKISNNKILSKNLVNIISNDIYYIYNKNGNNRFNIQNAYWFFNSKLLEPVLKQLNNHNVDISNFINHLTITLLLNFETKFSLKEICNSIIEKHNHNKINYRHFYNLLQSLTIYSSKAAKHLLHSGLVDDFLNKFTDEHGNNILMQSIINRDIKAIKLLYDINKTLDKTKQLDINLQNKQQKTALILAVESGYNEYIKAIFQLSKIPFIKNNNINFNNQDSKGFTALMYAVYKNYYHIIIALFQQAYYTNNNIDCDIKNNNGDTALMLAVYYGNYEAFHSLISSYLISLSNNNGNYMDICTKNYSNETTLTLILKHNHFNMLEFFLETIKNMFEDNLKTINIAVFQQDVFNSIVYILQNTSNEDICCKLITEVKNLLNININYDVVVDKEGNTLLMHAIMYNNPKIMETLLTSYSLINDNDIINISEQNSSNETALTLILKHNNLEILELFLKTIKSIFHNNPKAINIELFKQDVFNSIVYILQNTSNKDICCKLITEVKKSLDINIDLAI